MRKKFVVYLSLFTMMVLLISACGSGGSQPASSDATSGATSESNSETPSSTDESGGSDSGSSDEAAFFKGKTIRFLVPGSPGGGYDSISRSFAPIFEEKTGATVLVENVPAGGGNLAFNQIYAAEPDGLTIGLLNGTGAVMSTLAQDEGVEYDLKDFTYIGRVTAENKLFVAKSGNGIESFDDIVNASEPIKMSAGAPSNDITFFMIGLKKALDLPIELIPGYAGSKEFVLAVLNGEVDGTLIALGSIHDKVVGGEVTPLASIGKSKPTLPEYSDIPLLPGDYDVSEEGQKIIDTINNMVEIHRGLVAPPGLPEERRQFLEDVLKEAMEDPGLLDEWGKAAREPAFQPGNEYKATMTDLLENVPQTFLDAWNEEKENVRL